MRGTITVLASIYMPLLAFAAASTQHVSEVIMDGPDDLRSEISTGFLDCVNKTGVDYKIYVDEEGTVNVIPEDGGDVDYEGKDQALYQCVLKYNDDMYIAAEPYNEEWPEHQNATHSSTHTHESLAQQGANGKKAVGTRPVDSRAIEAFMAAENNTALRTRSNMTTQSSLLFLGWLSDFVGCEDTDYFHAFTTKCHNWMQAYTSGMFENIDTSRPLHLRYYPHHHCEKRNYKYLIISPGHLSGCQGYPKNLRHGRPIYSFIGWFIVCPIC